MSTVSNCPNFAGGGLGSNAGLGTSVAGNGRPGGGPSAAIFFRLFLVFFCGIYSVYPLKTASTAYSAIFLTVSYTRSSVRSRCGDFGALSIAPIIPPISIIKSACTPPSYSLIIKRAA